jgi:carbamoyl-phosphate synthase large subunit
MERRVLVTAAGSGASNNTIRSLAQGDPSIVVIGCHSDRFVLKKSTAVRNYLVAAPDDARFIEHVGRLVAREDIGLVIPTSDYYVRLFSGLRTHLPGRLFLPPDSVIALCQDKYRLAVHLAERGVAVPRTAPVGDADGLDDVVAKLAAGGKVWCRIRTGSGSAGAIPVTTAMQARSWIAYWNDMRGVPPAQFMLSEYLPGRDFACQMLWSRGALVLVKTHERLSYFDGQSRPSGVSSIPALAKIVVEPRVVEVAAAAVRALGDGISGAFEVDLKESADGTPCVTEINAGRLFSGTNLFDLTGRFNMAVTYVRLAHGEPLDIAEPYDVEDGYYMVRDLDTVPGVFRADELFEGIIELDELEEEPMGPGQLPKDDKCVIVLEVNGELSADQVAELNKAIGAVLTKYSGKVEKRYVMRGKRVEPR